MAEESLKDRIVAFATHVGSSETSAEESARKRGWLDDKGEPTESGRELIDALGDQGNTRTVFRGEM